MKKVIFIVLTTFVVVSCSKVGKNEYLISGDAKGIADGKTLILQVQDDSGMPKSLDTVKVKNGKFEIKGKVEEPQIAYVFFPELNNGFSLILEEGEIDAKVQKDSIQNTVITGTVNNDMFTKVLPDLKKFAKNSQNFTMKNQARYQKAVNDKNEAELKKLNEEFIAVQEASSNYAKDFIAKNPKSFVSLMLIGNLAKVDDASKAYNGLDASLKNTKIGKKMKEGIDKALASEKTPPPPPPAPAPTAEAVK